MWGRASPYLPGFLPIVGDPDSVSQGLKLLPPIPVMPLVLFALLWCNREGRGVEEGRKKRKKGGKKEGRREERKKGRESLIIKWYDMIWCQEMIKVSWSGLITMTSRVENIPSADPDLLNDRNTKESVSFLNVPLTEVPRISLTLHIESLPHFLHLPATGRTHTKS